jgi:tetratricopeptide (TPR) repeat protein
LAGLLWAGSISAQTPPAPPLTKDQSEAIKAENAAIVEVNGLIAQTNAAAQAKDWPKAKDLAGKLIAASAKLGAADPDNPNFHGSEPEYYKLLGDAHLNLGEYAEAVAAYEKCTGLIRVRAGDKVSTEHKKTMGAALVSEGNAWLKSGDSKKAIACYEQAAGYDPHPATAWFNICATEYNAGNMDDAVVAAGKCIALDPTKADAYFIKGSALFANGTLDASGKFVVPAEATAALQKYLELAPNGNHANDAKQMLDYAVVVKPTDQPKTP